MEKNSIKRKGMFCIRIFLIILALVFIFAGADRGEQSITFMRAVYICLECIGIG